MPYNSETETFYQAPATVVDSTPDGDTVQEGFDDRLTPALAGLYADLNLLKADGMISVGIPATTTARGIGRVATAADAAPGSTITNGPAFLDAATWKLSATPAAGIIPLADANGSLASWVDPVAAVAGAARNLKITTTGTNANVTCAADEVVVKNSSNKYLTLRGVSVSAAVTSSGAGGLDTGSVAASTWYYVHVIHNPTTQSTALLLSLSATSPTLPTGYTHWARVGTIRTDGTANKFPYLQNQFGKSVFNSVASGSNRTALPIMATGSAGNINTPTRVAIALSSFAPPIAARVRLLVIVNSAIADVAQNNNFGAHDSANPPPFYQNAGANCSFAITLPIESSNIYWASTGAQIYCLGWEEN